VGEEGVTLRDLLRAGEGGPEEKVVSRSCYQQLRLAMAKLPERQRRVLKGLYFQGLGVTELARGMGISPSSVKGLEARALKNLRGSGLTYFID
jgi:RNA polymerase sigma factor (sigma-70 family)